MGLRPIAPRRDNGANRRQRSRLMARLYSNENFPLPVVEKLRALGHDVLTIQEAGKADQAVPDKEVLAFATRENRSVLTLNRLHFIRLHREQPGHADIVVCKL